MLALLAVAARLRRGVPMIAASVLMTSMPLAMAQQYSPPAYPNPGQSPGYPGAGRRRLIPTRDMARPVLLRRLGKKRSRLHLAPLWVGNPGTGAGGDTVGCGCPATTSHARTQADIGFLVIGANDTAAGFGCPGTGDDIGCPALS